MCQSVWGIALAVVLNDENYELGREIFLSACVFLWKLKSRLKRVFESRKGELLAQTGPPWAEIQRLYSPSLAYFAFWRVLIHLVQAFTLSPDDKVTHWRLGFFLDLGEGLYFDISLLYFLPRPDFFLQIAHSLGIVIDISYFDMLILLWYFDITLLYSFWQENLFPASILSAPVLSFPPPPTSSWGRGRERDALLLGGRGRWFGKKIWHFLMFG